MRRPASREAIGVRRFPVPREASRGQCIALKMPMRPSGWSLPSVQGGTIARISAGIHRGNMLGFRWRPCCLGTSLSRTFTQFGEPTVPAQLTGDRGIARAATNSMFGQFVRQLKACRECGEVAGLFDTICSHCGAAHPVRIPVSAGVMITAVVCQIAIIILRAM